MLFLQYHFAPNITFEYKLGLSEKEKSQLLASFGSPRQLFRIFGYLSFFIHLFHPGNTFVKWTEISLNPLPSPQAIREAWEGSYPLCTEHSPTTGTTLPLDMGESPIGKGAPHIHFLYSQFSLFLARSLDNTSIVRDEYTQSYTSDHCLAPHHPNLSVFHCPTVPFPLSHPTLLST